MKETIMSFVPMATIYAIASFIAFSRRAGEQTKAQGFRRWRRMHLWIAGAFGAAFILGYIEWSQPIPTPSLMYLTGRHLIDCLIVACLIPPLLSILDRSQGFWRRTLLWIVGAFGAALILSFRGGRPGNLAWLLSSVGGYFVLCLLVICIAAPLHSFLVSRKKNPERAAPAEPQ